MASDIVGREQELAAIKAFLDVDGDWSRSLLLDGEAGVGETALWQAGLHEADARALHVLANRPLKTEAKLAFAEVGICSYRDT